MSEPINDGGPAYPRTYEVHTDWESAREASAGLSKREAFAMAAMQGICAHTGTYGSGGSPGDIGARAVEVADALLAALSKGQEHE